MYLSVLLTSLPAPFEQAVAQAAALGFTHVDVVALAERPTAHREALADSGLLVACASIGRGLPEGASLDAEAVTARRTALETMKRQLADAAALGATHAYLVPGFDATPAALGRFAEGCGLLTEYAAQRMVKLCVEPIPGRALASAAATLTWLEQVGHPGLMLLLDVGHCLISREDPAAVVRQAGPRLGYVHFDDNDGIGDLHWPLLTGRLTRETLGNVLTALAKGGYTGALSLELNPKNAEPLIALRQGKDLLEQCRGS